MEAPNPFHMMTPKDNHIDDMIDIKSFNIQIDKKNFIFELGKSFNKYNLIFKVNKLESELSNTSYLLSLNLNEFHNINAIFSLYKNIEEILLVTFILGQKYIKLKMVKNLNKLGITIK